MKKALIILNQNFGKFRAKQPLIVEVFNSGFMYKNHAIPKDCAEILAYAEPKRVQPLVSKLDILKQIKKQAGL
jgi:hypothetical protein